MSSEHLEAGRLALETLRLHLVGLVDHIDDEVSRDLLLALSEVETASHAVERLGAMAKGGASPEPPAPEAPSAHVLNLGNAAGQVAGQLGDLHEHITTAAAWCGADSAEEAKPYLLDALVTLNRLREALGLRLTLITNTASEAAHV